MLKALHSYSQHRHTERKSSAHARKLRSRVQNLQNLQQLLNRQTPVVETDGTLRCSINNSSTDDIINDTDSVDIGRETPLKPGQTVSLAQCRIKYQDEQAWTESRRNPAVSKHIKGSITLRRHQPGSVSLHPPAQSDGVKADSVGHVTTGCHVTRAKPQRRPWTALPCKYSEARLGVQGHQAVLQGHQAVLQENSRKPFSRQQSDISDTRYRSANGIQEVRDSQGTTQPHVVKLQLSDNMSQPITRSVAYQRRNKTTHAWYDSGHSMSQSVPTGGFLQRHYSSSSSSTPRTSGHDSVDHSSPAGKPSRGGPSNSYSYDGGMFLGAHVGQAEYFVIHPDWVSDAMTIKKLNVDSDKKTTSRSSKDHLTRSSARSWQRRRCMSAPPAKLRNPISWEQSSPVAIPFQNTNT